MDPEAKCEMRHGIPLNGGDSQPRRWRTTVRSQATRPVPRPESSRSTVSLCGALSCTREGKRSATTKPQKYRETCDVQSWSAKTARDFPHSRRIFPARLGVTIQARCNSGKGPALCMQEPVSRKDIMEKDVVCGMQVDPAKAAGTSEFQGKTYYFCSKGCKAKFDANPQQYTK